jgi:hypothetical protein
VIGRAATLALLTSGAGADAAEVAICSLVTKPANFDRQAVTFQGTATAVKKTTSRRGNDYTLFKLQGPRDCGTVDDDGHHSWCAPVASIRHHAKTGHS